MTNTGGCRARFRAFALVALGVLVGCDQSDPYKSPAFPFLGSYKNARDASPVLLRNEDWWLGFKDPTLNGVVAQALSGSLTLAIAKERVIEADAQRRSIPSDATLGLEGGVQRVGADGGRSDQTEAEGLYGFDWLLDPFGGTAAERRSAAAQVQIAEAEVDAAKLLLLLNVTNTYVDLRYNQRLLALREQELASRLKTLELVQTLFDASSATQLDVVRAEALVAQTRASIPALKAAIASRRNELALLAGVLPGTPPLDLGTGGQPRPRLSPDVGIPADLVRNRPDIRISERSYYAAVANVGAARADLYPQLSLSGAITLTSIRGISGTEYYFGPAFSFPPIGGGQKATVEARESQVRQAHTSWKATVLEAILDVESALVDYSSSISSVQASEKTVRLYRQVLELTRDLVTRDGATIRDLIDAEETIAIADITLAENVRRMSQAFINLNVSLGSGSSEGVVVGVPEVAVVAGQ